MDLKGWIFMVGVLGFVWGGFVWLMIRALRQERRRDRASRSAGASGMDAGSDTQPPRH